MSLVEVRGTNDSLVHPRGAVGVVTRTPAVEGEKFLVRFPYGFECLCSPMVEKVTPLGSELLSIREALAR